MSLFIIFCFIPVPSKPLQPRVFITYKSSPLRKNRDIIAIYRWLPPSEPNGIILRYKVTCWYIRDERRVTVCNDLVNAKTLEFQTSSLLANTTYYFQVSKDPHVCLKLQFSLSFHSIPEKMKLDVVKWETDACNRLRSLAIQWITGRHGWAFGNRDIFISPLMTLQSTKTFAHFLALCTTSTK